MNILSNKAVKTAFFISIYNNSELFQGDNTVIKKYTIMNLPFILPEASKSGYTFDGWTIDGNDESERITQITVDNCGITTLYAHWSINSYTITWKNEDGTTLKVQSYPYNSLPVYTGVNPTKAADAQYTYAFKGWTPIVTYVTGPATYTATYTATIRTYTVTWVDEDGTVLEKDENVEYGTTPSYDGVQPSKAETAQYTYSFAGWDKDIETVTENVTYKVVFNEEIRKYTITWKNDDGTVLSTTQVEYGTIPTYSGDSPTKVPTRQISYVHNGWTPEIVAVSGTATYVATFIAKTRLYAETIVVPYNSSYRTWSNIYKNQVNITFFYYDSSNTKKTLSLTKDTNYTISSLYDGVEEYTASTLTGNFVGNTYVAEITLINVDGYNMEDYPLLKYQTARIGYSSTTYYTIEDAIKAAGSSDTIILAGETGGNYVSTSFTSLPSSVSGYNSTDYYTIKGKLRVPFAGNDLDYHGAGGKNYSCRLCGASSWIGGHEKTYHGNNETTDITASDNVYSSLHIPEDVTLIVSSNGNLIIGALLAGSSSVKNRGVIVNDGTINVSGKVGAYGYIKGSGVININSGATVIDVLRIHDWLGGASSAGLNSASILPINAYSVHNISCTAKIYSGSTYEAFWTVEFDNTMFTGFQRGDNNGNMIIIGTDGLFNLTSGYILKSAKESDRDSSKSYLSSVTGSNQVQGQKDIIKIYGTCTDGNVSLSIKAGRMFTFNMKTSTSLALPISYMDISILNDNNGNIGNMTLVNNSYKLLPGSSLTVGTGATMTIGANVNLLIYDIDSCIADEAKRNKPFITTSGGQCVDRKNAYLSINGTVIVNQNGGIGGTIYTTTGSGGILKTNANSSNSDNHLSCSVLYITSFSEGMLSDSYGTATRTYKANLFAYNPTTESIGTSYTNATVGTDYVSTTDNGNYVLSAN